MRNLREYMTVTEAAEFLGVSASTLRNWDAAGKLRAARNPINRYRLYRREDLEKLLRRLHDRTAHRSAPRGRAHA